MPISVMTGMFVPLFVINTVNDEKKFLIVALSKYNM